MTVQELIDMMEKLNKNHEVVATDIYGEGTFKITSVVYGGGEWRVELTGEELS